jgi:hypothetical protein
MSALPTSRTLRVTLLDPNGIVAESQDFEVSVPEGGSIDEETDDLIAGQAVGEFTRRYASAMAAGGLAFSIRAEFVDG